MSGSAITVNRAPVLTLWATVVAQRLGCKEDLALTLGKAVAGLTAQSKGQRLGIYKKRSEAEKEAQREKEKGGDYFVPVCGRRIPVRETDDGPRALAKDKPIDPDSVRRYLDKAFGDELDKVRDAMTELAKAYKKDDLDQQAFDLYADFRPAVASGQKGWGQKGELDLKRIRSLGKK